MKLTRIRSGKCEVFVSGMDLHCPLCGVLVKDGERHACVEETVVRHSPKACGNRRQRRSTEVKA